MISYYDIRAARSAMRALQNKPLRRRKLDIHFSIPKVPLASEQMWSVSQTLPDCRFIHSNLEWSVDWSFASSTDRGSYCCLVLWVQDNPSDKDVNQGTLVVFNLDASVSNDDLRHIFGGYGEVKEVSCLFFLFHTPFVWMSVLEQSKAFSWSHHSYLMVKLLYPHFWSFAS